MRTSVFECGVSFRPVRQAGNNIFGTDPEPVATKSHMHGDKNKSTVFDAPAPAAAPAPTPAPAPAPAPAATATAKPAPTEDKSPSTGTLAGQYKQNQMKSSIFGNDEPAASRPISDKNRSNIFGAVEQDQHQGAGGRQGKRGTTKKKKKKKRVVLNDHSPEDSTDEKRKETFISRLFYLDPNASRSEFLLFLVCLISVHLPLPVS